jgi:hypothetical protein
MLLKLLIFIFIFIINKSNGSDIFSDHFNRMSYGLCSNCTLYPYVDNYGACPKILYSAKRVAQNCSSLNLASEYFSNWTTLYINPIYVTELLLQNNNFKSNLPYNVFNNVYLDLKFLDLSRNYLTETTTDLQLIDCSANYLNDIDLSFNYFTKFPLFSVTCMSLLQRLRISSNYLLINLDDPTVFNLPVDPANTNKLMPSLQILDLSYNNIQSLNQNGFTIFKYFPNLVFLNLMGNKIKQIAENPFIFTPYLQYLSLEFNLIECKLHLRWLKYYIIRNKIRLLGISKNGTQVTTPYFPTCFNALSQTNESILNLDDSLFYTDIYLSTLLSNTAALVPVNIDVLAGNSVDLDCMQYSVPTSNLWWSFNDRVLSKTVTTASPYQFIENFNETYSPYNKTSILRIKNIYPELGGIYSCNAFYFNVETNPYLNVSSIQFKVNVKANPNFDGGSRMLAAWEIALIVIGCILAFLLLCLLLFCCIYCCCYKRGLLCFKSSSSSTTSSSSSSSNLYNKKYGTSRSINSASSTVGFAGNKNKKLTDMEESASGFRDLNKSRPNYVINTISKGSLSNSGSGSNIVRKEINIKRTYSNSQMYQDPTIDSWRILPNKSCQSHEVLLNVSPSRCPIHTQQMGEMDNGRYRQYDETLVYNVNNNNNSNIYSNHNINNQSPSNVYTIRQPVEFVSTNEAFVNDNFETQNDHNGYLNRVATSRFSNSSFEKYQFTTTDDLNHNPSSQNYNNYFQSDKFNDVYIPIDRHKQYSNQSNNNRNNFMKYDSDV